mgnify:CR=1 FL=1
MSGPWGMYRPKPEPKALIDAEVAKLTTLRTWERRARERGESLADYVFDQGWLRR